MSADDATPRVTAAEAEALLAGLARGRDDGTGADVWPLYERAADLAQTVIDLHTELAALRAQRDDFVRANAELGLTTIESLYERNVLRTIVEGCTTAPTDAECEAHRRAGGTWLYRYAHARPVIFVHLGVQSRKVGGRWWPLDREGRPCAWPTVEGSTP